MKRYFRVLPLVLMSMTLSACNSVKYKEDSSVSNITDICSYKNLKITSYYVPRSVHAERQLVVEKTDGTNCSGTASASNARGRTDIGEWKLQDGILFENWHSWDTYPSGMKQEGDKLIIQDGKNTVHSTNLKIFAGMDSAN
ncbi:MAG: hypothetical protein H6981_03410 [Gammaproteobacteria bacterium]|nr:hypothetical protein [Gammaproteobacteria bacterium]MCP5135836.1 hypothetical protein [Gammaproteobacteria bacterium]